MNELKLGKEVDNVIGAFNELQNDPTVQKNVKMKIQEITDNLKEEASLSIKIHKALNDLDEIASDVNLQPYTRAQIWNIVSILEKI